MKKILFVSEKWTDGNPNLGLTNHFNNLFNPFKKIYPNIIVKNLFLDECYYSGIHINNKLKNHLDHNNPDLIVFSFLGGSPMNPSIDFLNTLNRKLLFIWPDTGYDFARNFIKNLNKFFHVSWAGEHLPETYKNHIFLATPQNEELFFPDQKENLVSFVGSLNGYAERSFYLNYLKTNKVPIFMSGGQREQKLTPEDYAKYLRRSLINLNFPESPSGFDQLKGRCLEVMASRSLLLSRKSPVHDKYFESGKHYVDFTNEEDLKNKISYLLNNPKETEEISKNGYDLYLNKYSFKCFWETIFNTFKL